MPFWQDKMPAIPRAYRTLPYRYTLRAAKSAQIGQPSTATAPGPRPPAPGPRPPAPGPRPPAPGPRPPAPGPRPPAPGPRPPAPGPRPPAPGPRPPAPGPRAVSRLGLLQAALWHDVCGLANSMPDTGRVISTVDDGPSLQITCRHLHRHADSKIFNLTHRHADSKIFNLTHRSIDTRIPKSLI